MMYERPFVLPQTTGRREGGKGEHTLQKHRERNRRTEWERFAKQKSDKKSSGAYRQRSGREKIMKHNAKREVVNSSLKKIYAQLFSLPWRGGRQMLAGAFIHMWGLLSGTWSVGRSAGRLGGHRSGTEGGKKLPPPPPYNAPEMNPFAQIHP